MRNTPLPLLLSAMAALACGAPQAAHAQQASNKPASAPPTSGMTVVRDQASGTLRAPTPAEAQALEAATTRALAPFQPAMTQGADGRRQVKLGEHGLVHSVVRRKADGTLEQHCTHDAEAAIAPQQTQSHTGGRDETR